MAKRHRPIVRQSLTSSLKRIRSRADTLTLRLICALLMVAVAAGTVHEIQGQEKPAQDLKSTIGRLSAFDHATRTNAARTLRRLPTVEVVPALTQAARSHADTFVRY